MGYICLVILYAILVYMLVAVNATTGAIGLVAVTALIGLCLWSERRAWNGGKCKKCSAALKQFDTDSQGGRGYCCTEGCDGSNVWISWPVDGRKA